MAEEQHILVGPTQKLIDLNPNDLDEYETVYVVRAPSTIKMCVLTQDDLDSGNEIPFQEQRGEITKSIRGDGTVNFYIALIADYDVEVTVTLFSREAQPVEPEQPAQNPYGEPDNEYTDAGTDIHINNELERHMSQTKEEDESSTFNAIVVILIISLIAGVVWHRSKK